MDQVWGRVTASCSAALWRSNTPRNANHAGETGELESALRSLVDGVVEPAAIVMAGQLGPVNRLLCEYLGFASDALSEGTLASLRVVESAAPPSRALLVHRDGRACMAEVGMLRVAVRGIAVELVTFRDAGESRVPERTASTVESLHGLVGASPAIREVHALVRSAARTLASVLITGATGSGKEVVARAIHLESDRRERPFVAVNCGALPDGLLESELFGHARGAFTGAHRDKRGQFTLADGGTILLDEIADLPMPMQVKLLRVLQDRRVHPLGSEHSASVDVRVIAATNADLPALVERGRFRADLYYRLCVVPIELPALCDRGDDVLLIADTILANLAQNEHKPRAWLTPEASRVLLDARWPGNVRELANALHFAVIRSGGDAIRPEHLPVRSIGARPINKGGRPSKLTSDDAKAALIRAHGSKTEAARLLGVSRATFYRHHDVDEAG